LDRARATKITLTLDIDAETDEGFPKDVQTIVRENAASLRITDLVSRENRWFHVPANLAANRLPDSVALSSDGNTAIQGGNADNSNVGAAWVFVQRTKDDCKNGGWLNFPSPPGPFTNQGQCVSYFAKQK
jgi:hypothetical protein